MFAATADTELPRSRLMFLAALSSALSVLAVYAYAKVLRPRFDRFTSAATVASALFVFGFVLAKFSAACPSAPDSRCSVQESAAAGFSLMLVPVALVAIPLVFSALAAVSRLLTLPVRSLRSVLARSPSPKSKSPKSKNRTKTTAKAKTSVRHSGSGRSKSSEKSGPA